MKVKEIKSATGEYALVAALQETPKAHSYYHKKSRSASDEL